MINVTITVERDGSTRSTSIAAGSIIEARVVMDRFFDRVENPPNAVLCKTMARVPGAIAGAGWIITTVGN